MASVALKSDQGAACRRQWLPIAQSSLRMGYAQMEDKVCPVGTRGTLILRTEGTMLDMQPLLPVNDSPTQTLLEELQSGNMHGAVSLLQECLCSQRINHSCHLLISHSGCSPHPLFCHNLGSVPGWKRDPSKGQTHPASPS